MGSFLSIVNNTGDEFLCNVGTDQAALGIFGTIATVVSATALIFATAGAAIPAVAAAGASAVAVTGITTASATAALSAVGGVATAAGLLQVIIAETTKKAEEEGYVRIPPGERHQFGPYSSSLWQQGHCRRIRASPDEEMTYIHDEVFMRPIFSGATDQSNLDHDIQFWIDKFGFENEVKIVLSPPEGQASWGDVNAPLITSPEGGARTLMTSDQLPFMCNVCGDKQAITIPDATVFIPDHGSYTCSEIEAAGENGEISENDCPLVRSFLEPCGCSVPPTPSIAPPPTRHLRHL
jgi:hypothetical protein